MNLRRWAFPGAGWNNCSTEEESSNEVFPREILSSSSLILGTAPILYYIFQFPLPRGRRQLFHRSEDHTPIESATLVNMVCCLVTTSLPHASPKPGSPLALHHGHANAPIRMFRRTFGHRRRRHRLGQAHHPATRKIRADGSDASCLKAADYSIS